MSDREARAAAAEILNGEAAAPDQAAAELECPECGRTFTSQASLNGHLAAHRGRGAKAGRAQATRERPRTSTPAPAKIAGLSGEARTVVNKAVANTQTVGALLSLVAPHTGLTIAGYRDPQTGAEVVRSRAAVAGDILLGHIAAAQSADELQRAAQILELLRRYNSIFEYSALGDVAGSLVVAAAIDARVIRPDFKLKVGQLELPVVEATIGDVVQELDRQGLYAEAPPNPEDGGQAPAPAETVEGGVEAT